MVRLLILPAIVLPLVAASLPTARPEEVGLSSERLQRIHEMVMRHVEARDISGAVTMVARRGRVVHFEAHGLMDIEAKKPMAKDALFRLASSSKPITAAAILMLMEEGKLKLTDPVAKYIPEFKNSKVALETVRGAVPMSDQASGNGDRYYLAPANHEITIIDLLTHTSGLATGGIANADFQSLLPELCTHLAFRAPVSLGWCCPCPFSPNPAPKSLAPLRLQAVHKVLCTPAEGSAGQPDQRRAGSITGA
jgi:CubicO group peptidase (beta-lactamase class C family)